MKEKIGTLLNKQNYFTSFLKNIFIFKFVQKKFFPEPDSAA